MLEDALYTYDAGHYLCCSVPIPVQASILNTSPQTPLIGAILRTDTPVMQNIALRMESTRLIGQEGSEIAPGICAAAWTPDFALALENLLCLIEEPDLIPVLGKARLQELMVAILRGQAGPAMRHGYGPAMEINRAIAHLREHPSQDISVDELAQRCGMSRAAFHKKFKATTNDSPLQFLKALRLNQAAMLLRLGHNVSEAASGVGYQSPSQFSREFRRHFGASPCEWASQATESNDETSSM